MIRVTLPDKSVMEMPDGASAADVAAKISPGLARASIGAKANFGDGDVKLDLGAPLGRDCSLRLITEKDVESLEILRHSAAHVMAEAICRLWPQTRLVYGPPVENGFYYDIELDHRLTPEDFPRIEAEMKQIIKEDRPFTRYEMSREQGMAKVQAEGNPYKLENAERAKGDRLSFYVTGNEPGKYWEDLCVGTHVPSTGRIGAVKVLSVSGAFLHGDASKQQLQRVNGTAFHTKKELDAYLTQLEEAKKRDHRRIGQELGLFTIDTLVGSGLILWKPKGGIVRHILEEHLRDKLIEYGYDMVYTPHIGRLDLYRTSGHFPYYRDAQFPPLYDSQTAWVLNELWVAIAEDPSGQSLPPATERLLDELKRIDPGTYDRLMGNTPQRTTGHLQREAGYAHHNLQLIREFLQESDGFLLKPMNCPHHIGIYRSEPRSYRDLPVRYGEFGTVYRYEKSGELAGMTRVRGFTQDDAHLFCTPEHLQQEVAGCMALTRYVLEILGLKDYRVRVGLHDPTDKKYIASPEAWAQAEAAIRKAVASSGLNSSEEIGEAAFYGPKIDYLVKDCIGREWQLGTVQVDYNLPERFDLTYVAQDNRPHRPIMVHRTLFGSMERFVGILIEHFEGAFPLWLAPTQIAVATISEKSNNYAREIAAGLKAAGIRVEVDDSPEKIGPKKHRARKLRIPYIAVVGEQEMQSRTVNLNDREGRQLDNMSLPLLVELLLQENKPGGRPKLSPAGA
ncbi:MAG TPA: threonine--tRNA ligase [Phycisphaerae bacterium]|nr:threonine--tRNA ligase [Phycisphaerae bacterium]